MSTSPVTCRDRLGQLCRAFDRSFAEPLRVAAEDRVSLLMIGCGRQPFALRSLQVTELVADRSLVAVPSRHPELLGIAGIRGALVPVFDLAALLGSARQEARPQWLVLADRHAPVGLAFDRLEGYSHVSPVDFYVEETSPGPRHVRQLVRTGSVVRGLIDIPAILQAIRGRACPQQKE
jgi:chemotaxis signal transduction protein